MKQFVLTPAAGKRLIARGMAARPEIKEVLSRGILVIVAGTTNGYVAEEILRSIKQMEGFKRGRFFRGITLPPHYETTGEGRLPDEKQFPGDVVIRDGVWLKGKTLMDVLDELKEGDIILKGANALDIEQRCAAVLIGHPKGGTIIAALQALVGKRVRLILPVGLEKRIPGDLYDLATRLNAPGIKGKRLLPVPGEVFTELDAVSILTGAKAELIAAGGVCGAEGGIWLAVSGNAQNESAAEKLMLSIAGEPPFTISA